MSDEQELIGKIRALGYDIRQTGYKSKEDHDKGIYSYRYWILPEENAKLKDTKFFNREKDFIHFTSVDAVFSILENKHLRMYNLPNMDDKYELNYALKALSFADGDDVGKTKEGIYVLSMCSSDVILTEEPKKKKHLLWKLHGKDGHGVVIRLKIENDVAKWYNYYLTECFYSLEPFESIARLHSKTQNELLDIKIASFIKLPIYEFENETRLVFDYNNSGWIGVSKEECLYPVVYPDKLDKASNISYFQLPLYNFFKNDGSAYPIPPNGIRERFEMPKISISEIIIGYRYNDDEFENMRTKILSFDQNISVRHSDLRQYYV